LKRWKATFFRPAGGKMGIPIVPGGKVEIPQKCRVVKWKFPKVLGVHITRFLCTTEILYTTIHTKYKLLVTPHIHIITFITSMHDA